mgnify:FL=1
MRMIAAAVLVALLTMVGCRIIEERAGSGAVTGLDNAASRPVIAAIEAKDPATAQAIIADANANQSAGTAWPWLSSILGHWDAIAAVLALGAGGTAYVARGKRVIELTKKHEWLTAASEAMSLGIELSTSKGVPLVDALKSAAQAKLGDGVTIRQAMDAGEAESVNLNTKTAA